jgi:hypothetical protein
VVFGVAVREHHGVLIAVRDLLARAREAGGIERLAALVDPCLRTDRQRQLLTPRVATIGIRVIKGAAQLQAIAGLGLEPFMKQASAGFVGKQLGGQREGPIGTAPALEHQPGHGFARCEDFLCIGHEACVDHVHQP